MFLKPSSKYNKTTQERSIVYRLCESYRINGSVRHYTVVYLGKLEEFPTDEEKEQLAARIEDLLKNGTNVLPFDTVAPKIEEMSRYFYEMIKKRKRWDIPQKKGEWETVDMSTMQNKDVKEIGLEWICKQALDQLRIVEFLKGQNWNDEKISLAITHIISRAVHPASELKTARWLKRNTALCEITGFPKEKITKDLLYGISHKLFSVKEALEKHLSTRTNELFDLEDTIMLYDLTNTYFEGQMRHSKKAKFGRSKEKRSDAKIIVLAIVINKEGFLKYSNIFEGNMSDCKTLEKMLDTMSANTSFSARKPIVVMDAGITTKKNILMLRQKGYDYVCVTRSNLKNYEVCSDSQPVRITDKKQQPIELFKVKVDTDDDYYLKVKSHAKEQKERSMNGKMSQRFEEGIQNIQYGITSKSGIKKLEKVYERIGRLKQKYPSIHPHYDIVVTDNGKGMATSISCRQKPISTADKEAGIYFLRTSLKENDENTIWTIYNLIREIEYTFRVLKTNLDLRPIYHKTDDASMAHLHLGIIAYWLVTTIRYQLKQKGVHFEWDEIKSIISTQKCVTTSIKNFRDETILVRQCSEPEEEVKMIYDLLKYKYAPFKRKKSVVPPVIFSKNTNPANQRVDSS